MFKKNSLKSFIVPENLQISMFDSFWIFLKYKKLNTIWIGYGLQEKYQKLYKKD